MTNQLKGKEDPEEAGRTEEAQSQPAERMPPAGQPEGYATPTAQEESGDSPKTEPSSILPEAPEEVPPTRTADTLPREEQERAGHVEREQDGDEQGIEQARDAPPDQEQESR